MSISPISTLPPELLLYIFSLAAGEPSAVFDTSPLGSSRSGEWRRSWTIPYPYGFDAIAERVKTRTALALVSKHWRGLSLEILFEYVALDASSLRTFLLVMKEDDFDTAAVPSSFTGRISRFVKHIDMTFSKPPSKDYVPLEIVNDELSPLFRLFTNLELLTIYIEIDIDGVGAEWRDAAERIVAIVANNGCRLRSIVGMTDFAIFPLLGTLQIDTVEVMELWGRPGMGTFWDDLPPVTFPRLNTLSLTASAYSIGSLFRWFSRCSMPSLTRYISSGPGDWDYIYPFFLAHGKSLVALDISHSDHITPSLLLPYCPSLQEVSVVAYELDEVVPTIPKLAYIGLSHCYFPSGSIDGSLRNIDLFYECMQYIFTHRTRGTLAVIYLLDCDLEQMSTVRLCGRSAVQKLRYWVEVCKAEGVRLEFDNNELVEIPEDADDPIEEIQVGVL
jgi:hypothetical protein